MGRASRRTRHYPKRLGEKLRQIRMALDLSQTGMVERLGNPEGILGTSISAYERSLREPPLLVLLKYARLAGVSVDVLIDDSLDLPKLPKKAKHVKYS
jgi:transcriptional regulator with XRE-family HTH domain